MNGIEHSRGGVGGSGAALGIATAVRLCAAAAMLLMAVSGIARARETGPEETFFKANQAYKEGEFREARDGYESLAARGYLNGHLYYNLANACFRMEETGSAVLNYERAMLFMPRDADLKFNLQHARDRLLDEVPDTGGVVTMTFFWLDQVTGTELFRVFAVLNVLLWACVATRLFVRFEWTFYACVVLAVFWVISGASFGLKWYQTAADDRAVILPVELPVLAGPDTGDTVLFKLHAGTTVHHERGEAGWSLIRLSGGKRGWVPADAVERIVPEGFFY